MSSLLTAKHRAAIRSRMEWMADYVSRVALSPDLTLWPVALLIGIAVGYAVIGFRLSISGLQTLFYGADDLMLHSTAAALPWYVVLVIPVLGGLAVGLLLTRLTPDSKARAVADVMRSAALQGGRVDRVPGIASALASLITLSTGGSTGREGPAIHLGAVMASWVSDRLRASAITGRDILGCAVAAAVSASFNAPLAGALFALEVVLRHYALHAFGPIVVAGVAATVVSRIHLGDVTEFTLPGHTVEFYWELPAFVLLGLLCGLVAVVMVRTIFFAETVGDRVQAALRLPDWARPAVAGLALGMLAMAAPHIIGVGYETTSLALTEAIPFWLAVAYAVIKVAAVAITLAGRMGGGVFSPALMLGALTGSAFGEVAIDIFPSVSGSQGLYALTGMGAMAGAVLGAPISSTLIVFELTGDWQAAIAVMIAVPLASVVAARLGTRSFFLMQLAQGGLHLAAGPQGYLKKTLTVGHLMRPRGAENGAPDGACWELHAQNVSLRQGDTLERALPMFERLKGPFLPVMAPPARRGEDPELIGALFQVDALRAYARTLEEELREEHS
ncbi:chloride channel protein [Paralimibaculum aggregatum]|uniref:Chloride channel protein n=1 Tax=Paralimibaculum aggregatum TaxID=3036245 RepID=A0ABQ6LJW7_9RHOB|nr:chloride channel protein [Limibaculum sp. NKW23]GMG83277.1 chloride channel protein [Limibaculum sp. NKW23]